MLIWIVPVKSMHSFCQVKKQRCEKFQAYLKISRSTSAEKRKSSTVHDGWVLDGVILLSLFNHSFPLRRHRNVGSRNVCSVPRRVLRLTSVPRMLISHRGCEGCSTMPGDRRPFEDVKKPGCAGSLAPAFSPTATTSLSHHNLPGDGPLHIHAPREPGSYERAICSYKGTYQRRTRCTNGLRSTCLH